MQQREEKIQFVYKRYLFVTFGFIAVYSFFNWLFFVHQHLFNIREEFTNAIIPLCLPVVPALIWLLPRFRLYAVDTKKKKGRAFGFVMLSTFLIGVPAILAQFYMYVQTGKLTTLESIQQIKQAPATKYYVLKNHFVNKEQVVFYPTSRVTSSRGGASKLELSLFAIMPVYESTSDTMRDENMYWLGIKYSKTIKNSLPADEKRGRSREFYENCRMRLDTTDVNHFDYLERLGNTAEHNRYNDGVRNNQYRVLGYALNSYVIFEPRYGSFASRGNKMLLWTLAALAGNAIIGFLIFGYPDFDQEKLEEFKQQMM